AGLRKSAAIHELGIAEMRVPVKIVVNGVVDSSMVFPAESDAERSHAREIAERGVIGSPAQHVQSQVLTLAQFAACLRRAGVLDLLQLFPLPDGKLGFRILDISRHIINEVLERVRTLQRKVAAAVAV